MSRHFSVVAILLLISFLVWGETNYVTAQEVPTTSGWRVDTEEAENAIELDKCSGLATWRSFSDLARQMSSSFFSGVKSGFLPTDAGDFLVSKQTRDLVQSPQMQGFLNECFGEDRIRRNIFVVSTLFLPDFGGHLPGYLAWYYGLAKIFTYLGTINFVTNHPVFFNWASRIAGLGFVSLMGLQTYGMSNEIYRKWTCKKDPLKCMQLDTVDEQLISIVNGSFLLLENRLNEVNSKLESGRLTPEEMTRLLEVQTELKQRLAERDEIMSEFNNHPQTPAIPPTLRGYPELTAPK